ncbi:hypothetical protein [Terriglobus sp.]|uniref:hypothetical protein n=1 Tax=Terriglobus sp. TaxID=1889013 RepID=UPI003B00200F
MHLNGVQVAWQKYGAGRDTGVRAYALLPEAIALKFSDGSVYLYDAVAPGRVHVRAMQRLAERGSGLTTYVNQFVRERYAGRVA